MLNVNRVYRVCACKKAKDDSKEHEEEEEVENNDKIVSEKINKCAKEYNAKAKKRDKLMCTLIISLLRSATYVPLDNENRVYGEALECHLASKSDEQWPMPKMMQIQQQLVSVRTRT